MVGRFFAPLAIISRSGNFWDNQEQRDCPDCLPETTLQQPKT
jgi:hypothetical protein